VGQLLTVDIWIKRVFEKNSRPHRNTVYKWIREGEIPVIRIGRKIYIDEAYGKHLQLIDELAIKKRIAEIRAKM